MLGRVPNYLLAAPNVDLLFERAAITINRTKGENKNGTG